MAMRNEELEAVQKDKDFIRNYLRQLNPGKKQPTQGSFKPLRNSNNAVGGSSGDGASSLVQSHTDPNNVMGQSGELDYQMDNVLGFSSPNEKGHARRYQSTVVDSDNFASKKSRKSIAMAQQ